MKTELPRYGTRDILIAWLQGAALGLVVLALFIGAVWLFDLL